jgi:GT2 family glycosyltransferase
MIRTDIVTVFHNATNYEQHLQLFDGIRRHEPRGGYRLIAVDNRVNNRGFAAACNLGAFHPDATAPVIAFLNPDVTVHGPFLESAIAALTDNAVIAGCRFDKAQAELDGWGVSDWVCGATFFVRRPWFTGVGGFDTQFVWSHEETDLIRQAETAGLRARSIALPLQHAPATVESDVDANYKRAHAAEAHRRYFRKWGRVHAV